MTENEKCESDDLVNNGLISFSSLNLDQKYGSCHLSEDEEVATYTSLNDDQDFYSPSTPSNSSSSSSSSSSPIQLQHQHEKVINDEKEKPSSSPFSVGDLSFYDGCSRYLEYGMPGGINVCAEEWSLELSKVIAAQFGIVPLAAHSILFTFFYHFC